MARPIFSCPDTRSFMPRSAVSSPQARRRFSLEGDGFTPIRTSHLSGSRHWGYSDREETPGPWFIRTPENRRCPAKVQVGRGGGDRGRVRGTPKQVQARPSPVPAGPRVHRALARRPAGAVQPLGGSMTGASRSRTILRGVGRGCAGARSRLDGSKPTPFPGRRRIPEPAQAKARPTSKSVPSRSM